MHKTRATKAGPRATTAPTRTPSRRKLHTRSTKTQKRRTTTASSLRYASLPTTIDSTHSSLSSPTPLFFAESGQNLSTALNPHSRRTRLFGTAHSHDSNNENVPAETSIKITPRNASSKKPDSIEHISIGDLVSHGSDGDFKRMSKQRSQTKEKKEKDRLVNTLYGDFVDAHDRGDGLAWAADDAKDPQQPKPNDQNGQDEAATPPLHEQILQLYLTNYQEQENRELEAHFGGGKPDLEQQQGRDQFLQQIVNNLSPRSYSRFVHSFRLCIQRVRTLLSKHQHQKQHMKDNIHMMTNLAVQEQLLQSRYQTELQEAQIVFFRQAAKLFGEHSDVFMPQLVIYLSSLTLTQLEIHRERQSTSQMNLYSCGFWDSLDGLHNSGDGEMTPAAAFRQQFHGYLFENNPTKNNPQPTPAHDVPIESFTFPVRIANKLYADLDIHTDQTSPLFFNKLARTHQRSHKVFVSNIPSTLTTRELMALFGNCGVLNAAEIYRDKLDQTSGATLESSPTSPQAAKLASLPGDENLYQGLSLTRKEAILQANAAALTIDISDIALGHFTSSFKSERILVPSHVIDGKLLQSAVGKHSKTQQQNLLGSDGLPMDPASSAFLQQDGTPSQVEAFTDTIQESFQSELNRFENLHNKRMQRQQRKTLKQQQAPGDADGDDDHIPVEAEHQQQQHVVDPMNPPVPFGAAHNPLSAYNFTNNSNTTTNSIATSRATNNNNNNNNNNMPKSAASDIEKFKLRDNFSPVYGFLYFSTPEGKRRALKQSLRVFGLSTASGYAMTTQDAAEKKELIISGLHRSMSGADVAHYIRETLRPHMALSKHFQDKSTINTNAQDAQDNAEASSSAKNHIIERVYVPRSFARSSGNHDFFNNNRGYAIVSFDSHDSAFNAFRHLQNSTISFVPVTQAGSLPPLPSADDDLNGVDKIDPNFSAESIRHGFAQQPSTVGESATTIARVVNVHWRKEKSRPPKQQHPITSYFPTFERPKQHLFHKVSQQLRAALPVLPSTHNFNQEQSQQSQQPQQQQQFDKM